MNSIKQLYKAEVEIYKGQRVALGGGKTLRFNYNKELDYYVELDCAITKDNQKTLSSVKPTIVSIISNLSVEDTGVVSLGERFIITDGFDNIGKGKITEVIKQL